MIKRKHIEELCGMLIFGAVVMFLGLAGSLQWGHLSILDFLLASTLLLVIATSAYFLRKIIERSRGR